MSWGHWILDLCGRGQILFGGSGFGHWMKLTFVWAKRGVLGVCSEVLCSCKMLNYFSFLSVSLTEKCHVAPPTGGHHLLLPSLDAILCILTTSVSWFKRPVHNPVSPVITTQPSPWTPAFLHDMLPCFICHALSKSSQLTYTYLVCLCPTEFTVLLLPWESLFHPVLFVPPSIANWRTSAAWFTCCFSFENKAIF